MICKSYSPEETEKIAEKLAKGLSCGDVICLDGELGAGKTAFTKGLCRALGVEEHISSPTYTIVNCYSGSINVYHIDAYRIEDSDEMYEIGFEDYLSDGICIIEWSVRIADILPQRRIEISISRDLSFDENYREIEIVKTGYEG